MPPDLLAGWWYGARFPHPSKKSSMTPCMYMKLVTHIISYTVCCETWIINFLNFFSELVEQIGTNHGLPLRTSFNKSRGFFIQIYTGPGADEKYSATTHTHTHTTPCRDGVVQEFSF